jgi:ABC-type uncharacterized transport system permease subunit
MMMMEAAGTSESSANFYQTTRRNNAEGSHLLSNVVFLYFLFVLRYNFCLTSELYAFTQAFVTSLSVTPAGMAAVLQQWSQR